MTEPVDPRDTTWEVDQPTYRVYFWEPPAGTAPPGAMYRCDEHRVLDADDVHAVLAWAEATAGPGRSFTLYVEARDAGQPGLVQLAGTDPTTGWGEMITVRSEPL